MGFILRGGRLGDVFIFQKSEGIGECALAPGAASEKTLQIFSLPHPASPVQDFAQGFLGHQGYS